MSCEIVGCNIRAYYNYPKTQPGKRCASHKCAGMVNVYNKTCRQQECLRRPVYNFPNEKRGVSCKEHSEKGMIDIQNPKCPICQRYGGSNFPGQKGIYCAKHALDGMVFTNKNKCKYKGCETTAKYNIPSAKKTGKYCFSHKLIGMINVSKGLCANENCTIPAMYGKISKTKPTHCSVHRENDMIDVIHKLCDHEKCSTRPVYNASGIHIGRFCAVHKHSGMVHINVYPCISCGLEFRFRNKTTSKLCVYCDSNSTVRSKTKENRIKELLQESFPDIPCIHDRSISSIETIDQKCVYRRFRPDFFYDMTTHVVIVEVDEHQHSMYDVSCERAREFHIADAVGRPTYFIRYNPDAYRVNGNIVKVKRTLRENKLIDVLRDLLFRTIEAQSALETVFLYYDEKNEIMK